MGSHRAFKITFPEITDPGNMAKDIYTSLATKIFAVLAGIAEDQL